MAQHPSVFDGSDETLLDTKQQREFFGNRSEMWIRRRELERDEAERRKPGSGFPLARWIANRKYRTLGECRRYRDAQPRFRVVTAPPPPPQSREAKAARAAKAAGTSSPE
jgi:hypothetical protein